MISIKTTSISYKHCHHYHDVYNVDFVDRGERITMTRCKLNIAMSMISIHLEQIDMNVILAPSAANVRQMYLHVKYNVF